MFIIYFFIWISRISIVLTYHKKNTAFWIISWNQPHDYHESDFTKKASIIQADNPKTFRALKVVASAISSGVLFKYAAIISTVTGKEQGSFRWKVQYRCRKIFDL